MFEIAVPATTANLGPGFDVLGLALEVYDKYQFKRTKSGFSYQMVGADPTKYGISLGKDNLFYQAYLHFFKHIDQQPPGLKVVCESNIPICRGLGSSAAVIVAGLMAANKMVGSPLGKEELLDLAVQLEGHPDNVAPAIFGGLVISLANQGKTIYHRYNLDDLHTVLIVPDFTLETRKARQVLPHQIDYKDALFNLSRVSLLITSLIEGDYQNLKELMKDRLHQPYRKKLIPGFVKVKEAGLNKGAYGVAISGAGPTIIAFTEKDKVKDIGQAMVNKFLEFDINAKWIEAGIHNKQLK